MCVFFSEHPLTVLSPWRQPVTTNSESHGDGPRQDRDSTCHNDPVSQTSRARSQSSLLAGVSGSQPAAVREQTGGGEKRRERGEDRWRGEFSRAFCLPRGVIKIFSLSLYWHFVFFDSHCFPYLLGDRKGTHCDRCYWFINKTHAFKADNISIGGHYSFVSYVILYLCFAQR